MKTRFSTSGKALTLEIQEGMKAHHFLKALAQWRMQYFKEYPYLYEGNDDYETEYLECYSRTSGAFILTIHENDTLAAISTGIPLCAEQSITNTAEEDFAAMNLNPQEFMYFGEMIIHPDYRGLGLASQIFEAQENFARNNGFKGTCFLTVLRDKKHPLKPDDYVAPDNIWEYMGYQRSNQTSIFDWPTIQIDGTSEEQSNEMIYWIKEL